jgi:hypothetical protein
MAVLCDGKTFRFYKFVNKHHAKASPQFFLGEFPDGSRKIDLDDTSPQGTLSLDAFYQRLRRACDTFYYVFLRGYRTGLEAYWKRSVEKGKAQGKATPGWHKAMVHATQALEEAISAWNLYNEGKLVESKASGEKAAQLLADRHVTPFSLVAVNANIGLLFIASEKLLMWRKHFCLIPLKRGGEY